MSHQMRPQQTLMTICDLCNEPIATEHHARQASLVHGYGGVRGEERAKAKAWYLRWVPRDWSGNWALSWKESQENPRYKPREYDFHTECLIDAVERAMAERTGSGDSR